LQLYGCSRVLVGAPEAQSRNQPSTVRQGGAVFKCRIDGDDSCEEIPFDKDGKHIEIIRPKKLKPSKLHVYYITTVL